MPRYLFHIHNDIEVLDDEGQEHANDGAALDAAVHYARDLAAESVRSGHLNLRHCITCVAADGREVAIVRFGDAVQIQG